MSLLRTLSPLAFLAVCAASFGGVACSQAADDGSGDDDTSAIIGGEASGTEDDAVVAIFRRGQPHCGGVVVGENTVVTALHCVSEIDMSNPRAPMLGERLKPSELTIRTGAKPGSRAAATVSRIVVEDPVKMDSGSVPMSSNDIAVLYIQPQDPSFAKIRPRHLATRSPQRGDSLTVVGYGADPEQQGSSSKSQFGQRERRDGVEILAAAGEREALQADLDDGTSVNWTNKTREFTTDTVACGGDSGGPAFDSQGNLVGIVSAVIGKCVEGSLSVFSDVASHRDFLAKAVSDVKNVGCLRDDQCGGASSGKICDGRTNHCVIGCRSGGNGCGTGKVCSAQNASPGVVGICRSSSAPAGDPSDSSYDTGAYTAPDVPGLTCPGNPLCPPTTTTQRECRQDADCNGQNGTKPRVCDIPMGRCLDGCRVATAGMCASGQACTAYQEDPLIGLCMVATPPPPPPGPPATPPTYQPEPAPASTPDITVGSGTGGADAGKKKNKAKADSGACSVSALGASGAGSTNVAGLSLGFGLAVAAMMRRRRR